ncbi:MAG TPA: bifunctional UDP-N-acetylmuramoyl-tripeptide:D-alanyl-D-alanine ligase/alanine racemase, partial [Flavobacterium sp.]|nr:bifunctional UDP-N-acetylmuramoyl-tripeptide:D-alanyl-D-alanine ligase/alanine racemase [Flavobacterium sp.]
MKVSVAALQKVLNAQYFGNETIFDFQDVSIDSRSLKNAEDVLFFAIQGKFHDAHQFIPELIQRGVKHFVVQYIPEEIQGKAQFFVVPNVLKAFQDFAIYYRSLFDFPVIGITGSNGKTIVKEWLNFLLAPYYNIIKSPKSYNSQVGVPISVIGINERHNLGIFEAGISTRNEMQVLGEIIQPTFGILTNIGSAHDEGFLSRQEKIQLFAQTEIVLIPNDQEVIGQLKDKKHLVWGFDASCDFYFEALEGNRFRVHHQNQTFEVEYPFTDKASVYNISTCISTLLYLGIKSEAIQKSVPQLPSINMRLQVKNGKNNCTLIDDSYASDYQSLKIALDVLEQQKTHRNKTVILSDILQSGFPDEVLYEKIAQLIQKNDIQKVIGIGEVISKHLPDYLSGTFFKTTETFLEHYNLNSFADETLLIKGSRVFSFERIVEELEEKTHETVLEINLDRITHNFNFYKSFVKPSTKMMVMIKAFGYGNGSYEIAKQLQHLQVDYLGVAFADEGVQLRKSGIETPIIVMNPENSAFSQMIRYKLQSEIYSLKELKQFTEVLEQFGESSYPVHIKLNTGMNRLGFTNKDFTELIEFLQTHHEIKVASIFSHLATSDMPEMDVFTRKQLDTFNQWSLQLIQTLGYAPLRHVLNTSGVFHYSEHQYDMVRLGIGLYGVGNSAQEQNHLLNVSQLKTVVLQINEIQTGEAVGYGRRFVAQHPTRIATLPIGYADGMRRAYGNGNGSVFIKGKKYPIVGSICMDMMMVDIGY